MTGSKSDHTIVLPEEIKKALLDGYEVCIKATKREGTKGLYAKITFHKVKVGGSDILKTE